MLAFRVSGLGMCGGTSASEAYKTTHLDPPMWFLFGFGFLVRTLTRTTKKV